VRNTSTTLSPRRSTEILRALLVLIGAGVWGLPGAALAASAVVAEVADPYIEMRTGPGRGYPVFNVVAKGERIVVLKQRTDWFKVRDERERTGWVHRDQLRRTLGADEQRLRLPAPSRDEFTSHRREIGFLAGDFGGASVINAYFSWSFNPHLSAELAASHILGNASNGKMATVALTHVVRPDWRLQPFATIGTGVLRVEPKATIIQPADRTDQVAFVGLGAKYHLTRQFIVRAEYRKYVTFTDRDDNQENNEWKIGLAFFF
jgi:opacity protein-like surface antigen